MSSASYSSSSRLSQFGLYRSIDARTEEFLRLSRKRQIRQGCACAAASTAITVTVVIVILLIYEYAIAVEWSLVQKKNGTDEGTNITNDSPFAERLNRNFFGFDQDYYERMPLLVNALQESNYIDPLLEMSRPISKKRYNKSTTTRPSLFTDPYRQTKIRRTSPRPFIFEYRSPTPLPFSKTYGSRSWVDSYRNAQRLQNIRQVIKYLEKTINAKMGDMYKKTPDSQTSIAFSGVYVEPMVDKSHNSDNLQSSDMQQSGSDKVESFHTNHQSDPLFKFKPNSPGDVNLLADELWRFAPILPMISSNSNNRVPNMPMFKKIPENKKQCFGDRCNENLDNADTKVIELLQNSTEYTDSPSTKPKSFSVMVNLFPYKPKQSTGFKLQDTTTQPPLDLQKIYFTTSKPVRFQFRRKNTLPVRRNYYRYKKPKYLIQKKNELEENSKTKNMEKSTQEPNLSDATNMIVHVNVYSPGDKTAIKKVTDSITEPTTTTTHASTFTPLTETPFEISSGQVQDFHDGSSGVIPVNDRTEHPYPILPQVTTIPFFGTDTASSDVNSWVTNPPDVMKFSPEDAKVPDHYLNYADTTTQVTATEMNRRTSVENLEEENETLIIRLKNDVASTTTEILTETTTEQVEETTAKRMYVPQTNGHARNFNARNNYSPPERNRKRKLEMAVTGFRTYVPMYVEIKRNKTKSTNED